MVKADKSKSKSFKTSDRIRSFSDAFRGIGTLLTNEHNARIHLVVLTAVVIAGLLLRIRPSEWLAIIIVAGLVFMSECFNTAVEYLSDLITREQNENIRKAKDVAAAGVLISAFAAVIAGLLIFIPAILKLIDR